MVSVGSQVLLHDLKSQAHLNRAAATSAATTRTMVEVAELSVSVGRMSGQTAHARTLVGREQSGSGGAQNEREEERARSVPWV